MVTGDIDEDQYDEQEDTEKEKRKGVNYICWSMKSYILKVTSCVVICKWSK